MKDSDKELLKASAAVVADQAVSAAGTALSGADKIALSVVGLGTAWGLTKAIFGNALKLREKRAIEWVELIRDNPEIFTEDVLATETFQDGFVYCVEQYLAERNEEKRQYIKNVFLGYVATGDHEEFPLERLLMTSQQLSNIDVATLKDVDLSRQDKSYQIYGSTDKNEDNIYNLTHLGLLSQFSDNRITEGYPAPFVRVTAFGKEFIEYATS
ncbi:MAG: hypothetical protein JWM81_407 [Candidatus Saccharibacteria bacterium]|nr:hypothetical protein [Candidatus Saccharibacteria bacterium]